MSSAHRNRRTEEREVLAALTRFHPTTDPEVKDLVDLGLRVLSGVVPESNPQASPGTCYLQAGKVGVGRGQGRAPAPQTHRPGVCLGQRRAGQHLKI